MSLWVIFFLRYPLPKQEKSAFQLQTLTHNEHCEPSPIGTKLLKIETIHPIYPLAFPYTLVVQCFLWLTRGLIVVIYTR